MEDVYVIVTPDKNVISVVRDLEKITKGFGMGGISCEGDDGGEMTLYAPNGVMVGRVTRTTLHL